MKILRWCAAFLVLVTGLVSCSNSKDDKPDVIGSIAFAPCPEPSGAAPARGGLPDLTLTCLNRSGTTFQLNQPIGVPMVVNLWASWCPPCGKELPAFQRLSDDTQGKLVVLGVVTEDEVKGAVGAATDIGLTFPNVYDRSGELRRELGRTGLPVTVFVDAQGQVKHVYNGAPLADESLRALVREHLAIEA
ncbi:MAG: TlpA family protein disulfide reductase [Corynebacteriales bacterium]|nr:TlpA family protein disulfide reductase [Mycobacteriales bacterium]